MPEDSSPTRPNVVVFPAEHWAQQAIADDDADSTLGTELPPSIASITSSIRKYRTLYGRTYHSEQGHARYWGTNDERFSDSLDILHQAFLVLLEDQLYLAPLENPQNVLDIGTGTGVWVMDFADEHPGSTVTGTDISPIQPTWVLPNVQFEIEDCTSPWTFASQAFDFVHMRYLLGSICDWTQLFREAYRVLEPGGYIESFEASPFIRTDDNDLPADTAIAQWGPIYAQAGEKFGRTFRVVDDNLQVKGLEEAGFVDIQVHDYNTPIGSWPTQPRQRAVGELTMYSVLQDVEGYILFVVNSLGWTREQVLAYTAQLHHEMQLNKYRTYFTVRLVHARKPFTEQNVRS